MDHYGLKLFLNLSETLHFGKTGRACNISPSALSRQVQRMEDAVGTRLFERDNRSVRLTPAGILYREFAGTVLEKWKELLENLAEDQETVRGEIRLYCSITASLSILPALLSTFRTNYPEVQIRLHTGDAGIAVRKVMEGEADIAVAALPESIPGQLAFKVMTQISLDFIAPAVPWAYSRSVRNHIEWDAIPMILPERGLARRRIDAWFKKKKIIPNIYAQVSGNEAILSMVGLGCGVGVVPRLAVENSPLQSRITRLNVKPELPPYDVGICIEKRKMNSRPVRAFWELQA